MSERSFIPERSAATSCDLLGAIDRFDALPTHVQHVARQIVATAQRACGAGAREHIGEADLRRAILTGFPDRVARRRAPGAPRLLLSSGTGARLTAESGVTSGEFLVSLDVLASSDHGNTSEARVRIASRVEREWLEPTEVVFEHRLDPDAGVVRATESAMYDALELQQRPAPVDPDRAATLLADAYIARGPSVADVQLLRRLEFAGHPVVVDALAYEAARRARRLADMSLHDALPRDEHQRLNALAPERLAIPSGRTVALEYRPEGTVSAAVKLQELFGLAETPRVGVNRQPVIFLLLAPNGRPVQTTSDLRSFWERTYPEVRKELRGRYPKHPWPDDPWSATPKRVK
jgi:ATP-dependent helicase HrpB